MANILVVEDELITARDIAETVQQGGHSVSDVVGSGPDAIHSAARARPDLVIMDIRLQGKMDGVATALKLQSKHQVPILYLSAHADAQTVERAKGTVPYGFVLKPFEPRALQTAVDMALSKRQAESAVYRRAEWLSTLVEAIGDAVLATDEHGLVRFANGVAVGLLGCGSGWEGMPAWSLLRFVHERTREFLDDPVATVLEHRTSIELAEDTALRGHDAKETPVEGSLAPLTDDDGFHGVVLILRDITGRRRAERERQRVQRLQSLEVLAGGLAHDFNNMLTMILASVSFARSLLESESRVADLLREAEAHCERATSLTRQLLTFAKGGAPARRPASIGSLVEDTVSFAARGSGVRHDFEIDESLWTAEVDEGQIAQVLSNLVINSCEAMPNGGSLHAAAKNRVVSETDGLPLEPGRYIEITVRDEGMGIAPDHIDHIFDPYYSTKDRGSGLGLTAAFSIIRGHQGHFTVESQRGRGTTFHIYLPASDRRSVPETQDSEPVESDRGLHVLLMDDEERLRAIVSACLKEMGHRVECARDGQAAVNHYRRAMTEGDPFDVVILDLTVSGGMGGQEAVRQLRTLDPAVRAIASSGYAKEPIMAEPQRYGFVAALPKPYRFGMLACALRKVAAASVSAA